MKAKALERTGWILILCGLVGAGITAADLFATYSGETIDASPVLAEAISSTLVPATVGALLATVGVILVLLSWWRGRRTQHMTGLQGASNWTRRTRRG